MSAESSVAVRARIHSALSDPARLAMVDILTLGDSSSGELAQALRLPTNLVAHHVKVLIETGLVTRSPSEGDRRRTYLRLVPQTLAALTPPPVRSVRAWFSSALIIRPVPNWPTALWAQRSTVPAASAGTQPAARRASPGCPGSRPPRPEHRRPATAHISDVLRDDDFVIAVCDNAHEIFRPTPSPPCTGRSRSRPADTDAAFEAAYTDIAARIDRLAPILTTGETP